MDAIPSSKGISGHNSSPINSFQRNIDKNSLEDPALSSISQENISFSDENTAIREISNAIKNIKIAYPNIDEIPLLIIKDENFLESGERIENY